MRSVPAGVLMQLQKLAEAAAMSKGIVASKKTEDGRPQITPEDIAAAAEGLLDQVRKQTWSS